MAIETFYPCEVEEIKELLVIKKEEIYQMWIYERAHNNYLGSLLPNLKDLIMDYNNENKALTLLLYKNNNKNNWETNYDEISLTITNNELINYTFYYL